MKVEFVYSSNYDSILLKDSKIKRKSNKFFWDKSKEIKQEWEKIEEKILEEISKITGLSWPDKNIICYLVTRSIPFADPLTIPVYENTSYFIDVLIHELIHVLFLRRNNPKIHKAIKHFKEKYSEEPLRTQLHIPLHAIHKHIYLKFFNKDRMKRDIGKKRAFDNESFERSWEIVQKEGYKNIIEEFRKRVKRN